MDFTGKTAITTGAASGMALCVYEHDANSTAAQPLLSTMKKICNEIDF